MRPISEDRLEELEAIGDLLRRIDVKGRAVFDSKKGEIGFVAVKRPIAIDEGAWIGLGCCDFLRQTLDAQSLGGILLARNDEPSGQIREESDAGEDNK